MQKNFSNVKHEFQNLFAPVSAGEVELAQKSFRCSRSSRRASSASLAQASLGISGQLTEAAKDYLTQQGYEAIFGARPLKRLMQRQIINALATKILAGELAKGDTVRIDTQEGKLVYAKNK